MKRLFSERLRFALVLLWVIPSVLLFLAVSIAMLRDPRFPFGLGLIQTKGPEGLWATVPVGLCGLAALLALLSRRRRLGARLLLVYSLFWVVTLTGGLVKGWHDARVEGPLNVSITDSLPAALVIAGMILGFALVALWSRRQAFPGPSSTVTRNRLMGE